MFLKFHRHIFQTRPLEISPMLLQVSIYFTDSAKQCAKGDMTKA